MTDQGGFTDPDPSPAPTPGDGDADEMVTDDDPIELVDASRDCRNCDHYPVCAVHATFRRNMGEQSEDGDIVGVPGQYEPGDADQETPVDPYDLAIICEAFSPAEGE